jgi:hypothetical protein
MLQGTEIPVEAVPSVLRLPRMRDVVTARVAATLAGVIALSAVLRFVLAWWLPVPWIFADELLYSELAKSFAATGTFSVREVAGLGYGPLYPILISPAYALFDSVPHAYLVIKAINSLVMSCAAVPSYFLARRLVSRGWAITVASLSVAVPSLVYTGMVMTESLFYPLVLATVLAVVRTLERPTGTRQLAAIGLVTLGILTRPQAVALLPALLTAIVAVSVGDVAADRLLPWPSAVFRRLRVYYPTFLALGGGIVAVFAWERAHGRSLFASFGAAQGVFHSSFAPAAVTKWLLYHVVELDLYAGVLPFAAFLILATFTFARGDRSVRVFAVVAVSTAFWLLLTVSAFISSLGSSPGAVPHIDDRYTFYLVPLLLIALAAWVTQRLPRPPAWAAAAGLTAGILPVVLPYGTLIRGNAIPDALALLPWATVRGGVLVAPAHILVRVVAITVILGLLFFLLRPPRLPYIVPLLVLLNFAAITSGAEIRVHGASVAASRFLGSDRDWIDEAVGAKAETVVISSGEADRLVIAESEFFNRSLGRVYYLKEPTGLGLPEEHVRVARSGQLYADGTQRPVRAPYVLLDRSIVPRGGRLVAVDRTTGMRLFAVASAGRADEIRLVRSS